MYSASLILISLVYAVPVLLLVDSTIVHGLLAAILSVAIVLAAASLQPGEDKFLTTVIRRTLVLAAIPAIWMLVQLVPVGAIGLGHPIWKAAEQALLYPIGSAISIDLGATLLSFSQYLCALAIVLLAAAVAIDRARAERILFALVGATALVAITVIAQHVMSLTGFMGPGTSGGHAQATNCLLLGLVLSVAAAARAFERYKTRHTPPNLPAIGLRRQIATCAAALTLCLIALALNLTSKLLFIALAGVGLLLAVVAIRHMNLGIWARIAIATISASVAVALIATEPNLGTVDWTLAFASPGPLVSVTQRILADVPWSGSGAGTFAYLLPIYQDAEGPANVLAPTAASAAAIELGRPMLWFVLIAVIIEIAALLRGSLHRRRDALYPAAGAGSLLLLLLIAFCDDGILGSPASVLTAAIVGLALAQSKSRTLT